MTYDHIEGRVTADGRIASVPVGKKEETKVADEKKEEKPIVVKPDVIRDMRDGLALFERDLTDVEKEIESRKYDLEQEIMSINREADIKRNEMVRAQNERIELLVGKKTLIEKIIAEKKERIKEMAKEV
jgi:hypothetical protein